MTEKEIEARIQVCHELLARSTDVSEMKNLAATIERLVMLEPDAGDENPEVAK